METRNRLKERWRNMSPAQTQQFRQRLETPADERQKQSVDRNFGFGKSSEAGTDSGSDSGGSGHGSGGGSGSGAGGKR